jgi:hypothetical protein
MVDRWLFFVHKYKRYMGSTIWEGNNSDGGEPSSMVDDRWLFFYAQVQKIHGQFFSEKGIITTAKAGHYHPLPQFTSGQTSAGRRPTYQRRGIGVTVAKAGYIVEYDGSPPSELFPSQIVLPMYLLYLCTKKSQRSTIDDGSPLS